MTPDSHFDIATQCPECGAQLVVNLHGHRQFTCGREDIYLRDDERPDGWYIDLFKPCRTSEIARQMTAAQKRRVDDPTREYFIVERVSGETKAGPFSTFSDAMAAAKDVRRTSRAALRLRISGVDGDKFVAIP